MQHEFDIAALGEAMVEFNQTHAGEPTYLQGFGGDTSNAVIAAARAGARTTYITRIGADRFGDELLRLWRHEGVDTSGVERDAQAHTAIYFVTHGAKGHEFSYLRASSAASRRRSCTSRAFRSRSRTPRATRFSRRCALRAAPAGWCRSIPTCA
jgi:2-dehydro-3-deoxygluconokinase